MDYQSTGSKSDVKLHLRMNGTSLQFCNEAYRRIRGQNVNITPKQICAGGEKGKDSCTGDSGGPLLGEDFLDGFSPYNYLAGIVSFGPVPCGAEGNLFQINFIFILNDIKKQSFQVYRVFTLKLVNIWIGLLTICDIDLLHFEFLTILQLKQMHISQTLNYKIISKSRNKKIFEPEIISLSPRECVNA